jgi:hypothetical protein
MPPSPKGEFAKSLTAVKFHVKENFPKDTLFESAPLGDGGGTSL